MKTVRRTVLRAVQDKASAALDGPEDRPTHSSPRPAFFISCLSLFALPALATEWIWTGHDHMGEGTAKFQKTFEVSGKIETARLIATADFAHLDVRLNGQLVGQAEAYDPSLDLNVAPYLKSGSNKLTLHAIGVEGPSAVAARLTVNETDVLETDDSWEGISLGKISPHRFEPGGLEAISPFDEYNQWKEALGAEADGSAQFSELPSGFEIELLRAAQEGEDSWVSLVFDPQGRIIIGKEKEGLLRLTLPDKKDKKIKVEHLDVPLQECRGLLWAYDSLYVNANRSKALYRLRDTNGDDEFNEVKLLREGGGGGHGRNDLALGPDGKIYAIHGDAVRLPDNANLFYPPEPEDAPPQGYLMRVDKDGKNCEVLNRGLRNPYGIDFNPDGEVFTYDADNEGDVGLPLYRPTRVNHLVIGANYGWQQAASGWSWPVYAPDSVPTTADIGRGSPTGVKFGTRSNFPPPYNEALYVLDWSYGRIIAVHLTPRGASYDAKPETFLRGRPLNVTDLGFGPDGAMYFTTGGRKTQAALYRVRYTGKGGRHEPPTAQAKARAEFSAKARELRHDLEQGKGLFPHLDSADPWIRNAARAAAERNGVKTGDSLPGLLIQARTDSQDQVVRKAAALKPDNWRRTEWLTLLRIYELCDVDSNSPSRDAILAQVNDQYPNFSTPLNRELCKLLVALEAPDVIPRTLRLIAQAEDQLERLHYLDVLSRAETGWDEDLRQTYFRALAHAKHFSKGDRFMPGFFQKIEENALANAPEKQRAELLALLEPAEDGEAPVQNRPVVKNWRLSDFDELDLSGRDLENGREMYSAALCNRCHQFGSLGTPVGPDLTAVASRFSPRDLLESIIEPSAVVAEVHRNVVITKKDGSTVIGRVIRDDFRASTIHVSSNPFAPAQLTPVHKGEIVSTDESPVSPMPAGLLNTLSREEVLDLLAFLLK